MYVNIIRVPSDEDWILARNNGRTTMGLKNKDSVLSGEEKIRMLLSEHSTIRSLVCQWEWVDLPSWASVHITRHKIGIEHYVQTQRNDRQNEYDRRKAPQDSPVIHKCIANAQAIINVSKVRLCAQASKETGLAWRIFLQQLSLCSKEIAGLCVSSCVYRNGICPEVYADCKFRETDYFMEVASKYRKLFDA